MIYQIEFNDENNRLFIVGSQARQCIPLSVIVIGLDSF